MKSVPSRYYEVWKATSLDNFLSKNLAGSALTLGPEQMPRDYLEPVTGVKKKGGFYPPRGCVSTTFQRPQLTSGPPF